MRAFVAVDMGSEIQEAIAKFQEEFSAGARPVRPDNTHITLAFLGDITEYQSRQVQDSLAGINFESFDLALEGTGAFPSARSPRVIWIGTDPAGGQKLASLARMVRDVIPGDVRQDRKPFTPHVTVVRIKGRAPGTEKILDRYGDAHFGSQAIREIRLKESVLTSSGPAYSDILVVKGGMV